MNHARRDAEWLAFNRPPSESYDAINPNHYKGDREFEPIDVIEDWGLGYHLGNALKYISRNGRKPGEDPREGLSKAIWYLERLQDKYAEEAAQKEDADDMLESIRRQEEVEFHALGDVARTNGILSTVIPGPDHAMFAEYEDDIWEAEREFFAQAADRTQNDGIPGASYEDIVQFTLDNDRYETVDPYEQLPSDVEPIYDFDR